jgi:hypothetical protein
LKEVIAETQALMGLGSDVAADLVEVHLYGAGVGAGQHEGDALGAHGADRAEQVCVGVSLIGGQAWACSSFRPTAASAMVSARARLSRTSYRAGVAPHPGPWHGVCVAVLATLLRDSPKPARAAAEW